MGNCLTSNNKILAENDEEEGTQGRCQAEAMKATNLGGAEIKKKKVKKVVRFKLDEENNNGDRGNELDDQSKNGVVRIRVVVSQEELKQILSSRKDLKQSSMEQLVRIMKSRVSEAAGRRRSGNDNDDGFHGAWRPELESIPEEH